MSAPLESPEFENLYIGDPHDDDPKVIDSLVQEVDEPAEPVVGPIDATPLIASKPAGRLLTGTIVFDNTNQPTSPIQILPADMRRKRVRLDGWSFVAAPTNTDFAIYSDENGKVQASTSSPARLRHSQGVTLDEYTGPIYALPNSTITGLFEVTWVAVTE